MTETPLYTHDCQKCKYLGSFYCHDNDRNYDLYFCNAAWQTPIARYGDEGSAYNSGLAFVGHSGMDALTEAARRAVAAGLLDPNTKTGSAKSRTVGYYLFNAEQTLELDDTET